MRLFFIPSGIEDLAYDKKHVWMFNVDVISEKKEEDQFILRLMFEMKPLP